jgi:hypothetical protein
MTTEGRLDRLEEVSEKLTELMATVVTAIQHQQELLDEVRQDTKMTRRLWVRLAAKHGWLDDDDLNGDGP